MTRKKPPARPAAPKEKPFFRPFAGVARELPKAPAAAAKADEPRRAAKPPPDAGPEPSFRDLLYGVTPMAPGPRHDPQKVSVDAAPPRAADPDESARAYLRDLVSGGTARFETSDDGTRIEGRRIDVDARVLRRLRRGEMSIDARCDLHGLSTADARARVEEFVSRSRARGERVLLIIHGRGLHSPGRAGVLRGEMGSWLSQGAVSAQVAAFSTALPDDGGDGAVYVLLR
jgi:DNA-nicking Smr family endonuclease